MGFALQLQQLLRAMAPSRQTLLFSATMPRALAQFARAGLKDDVALIRLEQETKLSDTLKVAFFLTRPRDKVAAFCATLKLVVPDPSKLTIVFVATRHHAELLLALCRVVFPERRAHAIYGTLDQQARTDHLKAFRKGDAPLLIVTDVAARGLDVPLVDAVINYDAPAAARLFVHRCGRAARQGRPGLAATLVEPDEMPYIVDLHACGAEIMASSRCRRVDGVCALVDVLTDAMRVAGRVDGVERSVGTPPARHRRDARVDAFPPTQAPLPG
jgi:ATP-dependent RNA helicase DDX54/DBP10